MNEECYKCMGDKVKQYDKIKSIIERHESFLTRQAKRPDLPLSASFNYNSVVVDFNESFKEKLIELVKEQLIVYEQIINEL